jgi:hypothetical protein
MNNVYIIGKARQYLHRKTTTDPERDAVFAAWEAITGVVSGDIVLAFPGIGQPRYFDIPVSGHHVRLGARKTVDAIEIAVVKVSKD